MRWRWLLSGLVGLAAWAGTLPADERSAPVSVPSTNLSPFAAPAAQVPVDSLSPALRDKVRAVLERPTLSSRSVPETFNTDHAVYRYLLDHPDHSIKLWRKLGAKVAEIDDRGSGTYVWQDGQGSEVTWQIAHREPGRLIVWYAEGKVKPTVLLAAQPFRAVAMLQYTEGTDVAGLPAVRHQVHFHLRCESRAIALVAKILGSSAPRLAEQYLGQLQMFYGGMGWYVYQDQERAKKLFKDAGLSYPFEDSSGQ
jgi:hypothetical protein